MTEVALSSLHFILAVGAMCALLPAATEVAIGLRGRGKQGSKHGVDRLGRADRLLFLIPAHNEEQSIAACVRSIVASNGASTVHRIIVVADNCDDATAMEARDAGATVLERFDPLEPGKPAAIDWVLRQIPSSAYDAVVIVDADTAVAPEFTHALLESSPLRDQVVQAYFGTREPGASWLTRLAHLLSRIRYEGQYPAKSRAGISCPLTGNGMCIGANVIASIGWPARSLTENWELYARCVTAGQTIQFQRTAVLYSDEASTLAAGRVQRKRWQAGRADVAKRFLPSIWSSERTLLQKLDATVELGYPSPVVHTAVVGVLMLIASMTGAHATATIYAASALPLIIWTAWGWMTSGERLATGAALLGLPVYAIWRVGIWVLGVLAKPARWERSPRTALPG